jgi:hypothetical protein
VRPGYCLKAATSAIRRRRDRRARDVGAEPALLIGPSRRAGGVQVLQPPRRPGGVLCFVSLVLVVHCMACFQKFV